MKATKETKKFLRQIASEGGKNAALRLTSEQRTERARKASLARWAKKNTGHKVTGTFQHYDEVI